MAPSSLRVQIVTDRAELRSLQGDWDDLYSRANNPVVTQSFEWFWSILTRLMPDARVHVILIWRQERLVLIWPAATVRYERFWRAEVPIAGGGDYVDFLAEDSPEARTAAELAWQNRCQKADLLVLSRVRVASLLHEMIANQAAKPFQTLPGRYVDWNRFTDWNAYHKSLSERKSIGRRERRLLERGKVSLTVADEVDAVRGLSKWMLRHKEIWLDTKGAESPWVGSKTYEDFLLSIPCELKKFGHMLAFGLLLEDQTIAVQICVAEASRLILLHNAYDQEFRAFGPQHLLTIRIMEWACERRLNVEFCVGSEPYKEDFAPENCPVEEFRIPTTGFGKLHEWLIGLKRTKGAAFVKKMIRKTRAARPIPQASVGQA